MNDSACGIMQFPAKHKYLSGSIGCNMSNLVSAAMAVYPEKTEEITTIIYPYEAAAMPQTLYDKVE